MCIFTDYFERKLVQLYCVSTRIKLGTRSGVSAGFGCYKFAGWWKAAWLIVGSRWLVQDRSLFNYSGTVRETTRVNGSFYSIHFCYRCPVWVCWHFLQFGHFYTWLFIQTALLGSYMRKSAGRVNIGLRFVKIESSPLPSTSCLWSN